MASTKTTLLDKISELDQLIKAGSLPEARELFLSIRLRSAPRELAVDLAKIAKRLNMPAMMIRILRPIVRSEQVLKQTPTLQELALYASALSRLGVFQESEEILGRISEPENPEVLLVSAQHAMLRWDYAKAIPRLKKYVQSPNLTLYEKLSGAVNLAASLIWNLQFDQGEKCLQEIWDQIQQQSLVEQYRMLYGYSFELAFEMEILKTNYKKARQYLAEIEKVGMGSGHRYEFYAKKWKIILEILENPKDQKLLLQLQEIKTESQKLKEWEVLRDCEFYEALITRNDLLFRKVYIGSQSSSYRLRIEKIYQPQFKIGKEFSWQLGPGPTERVFDLFLGHEIGKSSSLQSQPLLLQILVSLTQDFYRPLPMGSLFSILYPKEYFNPTTSPKRVNQLTIRLRTWLKKNQIPIEIHFENESLYLSATEPYRLLLNSKNKSEKSQHETPLLRLKSQFETKTFTTEMAAQTLKVSNRSALRIIQTGLKKRAIISVRAGKSATYRFRSQSKG